MKQCHTPFYFLFTFLIFTNCNVGEQYLERQDYDAAFRFASNRLDRKKQKTKHLQTLEIAFAEANQRDLERIEYLRQRNDRVGWEKIHFLHSKMKARQEKVRKLLPLASEDGYRPRVSLYPVGAWLSDSYKEVVAAYLREIREHLHLATAGKKQEARHALALLEQLESRYFWQDEQAQILADSCWELGTFHIFLGLENRSADYDANLVLSWLDEMEMNLKSDWKMLYRVPSPDVDFDLIAHVEIVGTYVSGDQVSTSCRTERKEVEIGEKVTVDTSGKKTKEPIYGTVSATITETELTKKSKVESILTIADARTGHVIFEEKITGWGNYSDSFCIISGDERATNCICFGGSCSFPSDKSMLKRATRNLNWKLGCQLRKFDTMR